MSTHRWWWRALMQTYRWYLDKTYQSAYFFFLPSAMKNNQTEEAGVWAEPMELSIWPQQWLPSCLCMPRMSLSAVCFPGRSLSPAVSPMIRNRLRNIFSHLQQPDRASGVQTYCRCFTFLTASLQSMLGHSKWVAGGPRCALICWQWFHHLVPDTSTIMCSEVSISHPKWHGHRFLHFCYESRHGW